jgi:Na+/H+-translocating membrane pyrophosphatase
VWLCVLVCLVAIVASLASALYHLSRSTETDSGKLARALTVRISLSLVLFLLLMLAWYFGLIKPHPLVVNLPHP